MPFGNNINYAAVFNRILDEKFYIMPRTMWMENTTPGIQWNGGKEIKIPMLSMDGLGDMQNCQAPDGSMDLDWETKTLEYWRGRNFQICRYEIDMTNFALTVENALRVLLNEHVVPELDKIRIGRLVQAGFSYGANCIKTQASSGITSDNILSLILNDIATVQDKIGENQQLYIQISTQLKNLLQQSSQITRFLDVKDYQIRSITTRIDAINDQYLIGTPSRYMGSVFRLNDGRTDGQTVGGVEFADLGPGVNWIVAARPVVDAVARPRVTKVIDPDVNQDGEFWKIMFSIYHGVWTYQNKKDGLLVNVNNELGDLTVESVSAGSGQTVITVNAAGNADTQLVYKTDASAAPTVTFGTALTASDRWAPLPENGQIAGTNGQYVTVALVGTQSGLPLADGNATIVSGT